MGDTAEKEALRQTRSGMQVLLVRIIILLGLLFNFMHILRHSHTGSDFLQDYLAAHAFRSGEDIYSEFAKGSSTALIERLGETSVKNFHPPIYALLYLPLTYLSYQSAFILFGCINLIGLWWLVKSAKIGFAKSPLDAPSLYALTLFWYPTTYTIGTGQISILLALLILAALRAAEAGKSRGSGVLLGSAILLKLFPAFIALGAFIRGHARVTVATFFTVMSAYAALLWIGGVEAIVEYWTQVIPENIRVWEGFVLNQSMSGVLTPIFQSYGYITPIVVNSQAALFITLILKCTVAALSCWSVFCDRIHNRPLCLSWWTLALAMMLLSPLTWQHSFVILIPFLYLEFSNCLARGSLRERLIFLFGLTLCSLPDVYIGRWLTNGIVQEGIPLIGYVLFLKAPFWGLVVFWSHSIRRSLK